MLPLLKIRSQSDSNWEALCFRSVGTHTIERTVVFRTPHSPSLAGTSSHCGLQPASMLVTMSATVSFFHPTSTLKNPAKFIYRKIKNLFPLAFWSIELRGVDELPWSGGWEAENRAAFFLEDNDHVY